MRNLNWRVVAPILLVGALLGWLVVWRSARASNPFLPWIGVGLPILLVVFAFIAVAALLRRRKSSRTWELMLNVDPNAIHFITFVYPPVKTQLGRLGWRVYGSSYASVPAVGVSISATAIKFWEARVPEPTLTLRASDIESAIVGRVGDGYRSHPAIELRLNTTDC